MEIFVTCGAYLEPLLEEELRGLGYKSLRSGYRGVYVDIEGLGDIYHINYNTRIASRVLLPLKKFRCAHRDDLYKAAAALHWFPFFRKAKTFAIDANVDHPRIRNSLFAAQVVKDAICDELTKARGNRPDVNTYQPDLQLNLFLRGSEGVLSLDTSGSPLHKRGYRQEGSEAPMQETLAAALLRIANYDPEKDIFIDPCAGSGTILIEAMMLASNTAPGLYRQKWGFSHHPEFNEQEWLSVKNNSDSLRKPLQPHRFFGVEINRNTQRICLANLRASGFHREATAICGDFRSYVPPVLPNFLLTNPPYGKRLDELEHLVPLYRSLGDYMKRQLAKPSRGFIFTGSYELSKEVGLAAKKRTVLDNGGIESRLLEFDIY